MFKNRILSLLVLLAAVVTGAWAQQYETHWPDFSSEGYEGQNPLVAAIKIDGEIINIDDPRWNALEVAFFVGDECRGNEYFLYGGYVIEYDDPFPVLDGSPIFYNTPGETVSFKMYDHLNGILYDECIVLYGGEPMTIHTGEDHMEGWDDPENPVFLCFTSPAAPATYTVTLKEGTEDADNWTITPAEATTTGVAAGTTVTATYGGTKKVKSVKAKKKAPAAPSYDNTLNINTYDPELNNWEDVTVPTGKHWLITGTGEATTNTIIIANNATVTLSGVNITTWGRSITCEGNATIILADGTTNNLYAADEFGAAGIEMSGGSGTSLTIQGNTGVLNITSGSGPAIGAGYGHAGCAINIEGGIINATSTDGPGIGAAYNTACGNITISGGTVAATGGYGCPGIGGAGSANCGDITITSGVTSVTATKGSEAPYSIGASSSGSCGTVTIEDPSKVTEN